MLNILVAVRRRFVQRSKVRISTDILHLRESFIKLYLKNHINSDTVNGYYKKDRNIENRRFQYPVFCAKIGKEFIWIKY